jgi:tRNA threonylcarbamoyl adenosine modification protein YeaZ
MVTLAIELSSAAGSFALLQGEQPLVEREWREDPAHRQSFFTALEAEIAGGRVDLAAVELFAVGLGPGAFTGLRVAVSAALAMAAPGGRPVYGVSSAAVLALEALETWPAEAVLVIGDARREHLWAARYERQGGNLPPGGDLALVGRASVPGALCGGDTLWVTPDWDRIGSCLEGLCPPGNRLLRQPVFPCARAVGRLALRRMEAGVPSDPLAPIYMHPAVAVAPAF